MGTMPSSLLPTVRICLSHCRGLAGPWLTILLMPVQFEGFLEIEERDELAMMEAVYRLGPVSVAIDACGCGRRCSWTAFRHGLFILNPPHCILPRTNPPYCTHPHTNLPYCILPHMHCTLGPCCSTVTMTPAVALFP